MKLWNILLFYFSLIRLQVGKSLSECFGFSQWWHLSDRKLTDKAVAGGEGGGDVSQLGGASELCSNWKLWGCSSESIMGGSSVSASHTYKRRIRELKRGNHRGEQIHSWVEPHSCDAFFLHFSPSLFPSPPWPFPVTFPCNLLLNPTCYFIANWLLASSFFPHLSSLQLPPCSPLLSSSTPLNLIHSCHPKLFLSHLLFPAFTPQLLFSALITDIKISVCHPTPLPPLFTPFPPHHLQPVCLITWPTYSFFFPFTSSNLSLL